MLLQHKLNDSNKVSNTILTFGNFDGLHLGHMKLLETIRLLSRKINAKSVILTFTPHTSTVLNLSANYKCLTTYKEKINILSSKLIDIICEVDFTDKFSLIEPDHFMDILINKYSPKCVVLGYDNKFGKNGMGNIEHLRSKKRYRNIDFVEVAPFAIENKIIKSSLIRKFILNGKIQEANKCLNRPYQISGIVVKGDSMGRTLGFPTANIKISNKEQLIPKNGVYSVTLILDSSNKNAICNIGIRPTLKMDTKLQIEVHIINDKINLYDKEVKINFNHFIRDEKKFENKKQLIEQIKIDISSLKKEGEA